MGHGSGLIKWSRNEGHWWRRWQRARRLDGQNIIRWISHVDAANVTETDGRSSRKEQCELGAKVFSE